MNIIERLLAIIAPHECLGCAAEGSPLCYVCQIALPRRVAKCYRCGRTDAGNKVCTSCRSSSSLYALTAVTPYEQVAKTLVRGLKYERKRAGAAAIAQAMALHLEPALFKGCIITHIPTVPRRIRIRGYDQAELIAKELSIRLGLPYRQFLTRMGTQRQVGQSRSVRMQQMQSAFRAASEHKLQNQHVLLIDDVITTGATLEAAARALRLAGARRVSAAVFAEA